MLFFALIIPVSMLVFATIFGKGGLGVVTALCFEILREEFL